MPLPTVPVTNALPARWTRRNFLLTGGAIAAAAAAAGPLAGCGNNSSGNTPGAKTTLTMWNQPTFADSVAEKKFWNSVATRFNQKFPNVELEVQWIPWDQAFAKASAAVRAGNPPDFTQTGSEQAITFAAQDYVEPVDDVIATHSEASWGTPLPYYKYDGQYYGVTYLNGCYIYYYRKDLLEKAGFAQAPANWDDWVQAAKAVQNPSADLYGIGIDYSAGTSTQQLFSGFMAAAGGEMLNKEGKLDVASTANADALRFYTALGKTDKVIPPNVTALTQYNTTATPLDQWYGQGRLASTFRWAIQAPAFADQYKDIWDKTGVAPLPQGPGGRSGAFMAANPFWIFKQSKNKQAAKDFLTWFQADDIQAELSETSGWLPARTEVTTANDDAEWYKTCKAAMPTAVRTGWSYGANRYNGDAENAFFMGAAVQDVILKDQDPTQAVKAMQEKYAKIYQQS